MFYLNALSLGHDSVHQDPSMDKSRLIHNSFDPANFLGC